MSISRDAALQQAHGFVSASGGLKRYDKRRNYVSDDLSEVSRLSPATRHRLITEYELAQMAVDSVGMPRAEKFVQEIYWRLYWKGWLEQRPQVWTEYLQALDDFSAEARSRAAEVAGGEAGVAIMDYFSGQLRDTGYMHNHARMWFAAYWVHTLGLPWQLGAQFFMSHLLDGDPASNTLSWRWVVGLQTRGKTYLVRRSNLEKYIEPELLLQHSAGLEKIDDDLAAPADVPYVELPERQALDDLPDRLVDGDFGRVGIWLHEDDLAFEDSPLANIKPVAVYAGHHAREWAELSLAARRTQYIGDCMTDARARAQAHWPGAVVTDSLDWVSEHDLATIICLQPAVGPAADALTHLKESGAHVIALRRPQDAQVLKLATAGFFGFWKKASKLLPRLHAIS